MSQLCYWLFFILFLIVISFNSASCFPSILTMKIGSMLIQSYGILWIHYIILGFYLVTRFYTDKGAYWVKQETLRHLKYKQHML